MGSCSRKRLSVNSSRSGDALLKKRENLNSKTLTVKDSSIRSFWTCLTASPCSTANTNKHNNTTNRSIKQLINTVSRFLQTCRNIRIKFLSWVYMYTTEREGEREENRTLECVIFARHLFRCFAKMLVGTVKSVVVFPGRCFHGCLALMQCTGLFHRRGRGNDVCCGLFQLVFLRRNKKGVTTLNILNPENEGIGTYT